MKSTIRSLWTFFALMLSVEQLEAATPVEALKAQLTELKSYSASFVQTTYVGSNIKEKLTGQVHLQRTAKLFWRIDPPQARLIVSDGKTLWDYDEDLEQIIVKRIDGRLPSSPLYFLCGHLEQLEKEFSIKRLPTRDKHSHHFQLTPRTPDAAFEWIKLGFVQNRLNNLELMDSMGQRSLFQFADIKVNQAIKPTVFQFKAPPGVDQIKG